MTSPSAQILKLSFWVTPVAQGPVDPSSPVRVAMRESRLPMDRRLPLEWGAIIGRARRFVCVPEVRFAPEPCGEGVLPVPCGFRFGWIQTR